MGCCFSRRDPRLDDPIHRRVIEQLKVCYASDYPLHVKSCNQILLQAPRKLVPGFAALKAHFDSVAGDDGKAALQSLVQTDLLDWGGRDDDTAALCEEAGLTADASVDLHTFVLLLVLLFLDALVPALQQGRPRPGAVPAIASRLVLDAVIFGVDSFVFFDFFCRGFLTRKELFHGLRETNTKAPPRRGSMEAALERDARASTTSAREREGGSHSGRLGMGMSRRSHVGGVSQRPSASGSRHDGRHSPRSRRNSHTSFRLAHASGPSLSGAISRGISSGDLGKAGGTEAHNAARLAGGVRKTQLVALFEERFKEMDDTGTGVITVDELMIHLGKWFGGTEAGAEGNADKAEEKQPLSTNAISLGVW